MILWRLKINTRIKSIKRDISRNHIKGIKKKDKKKMRIIRIPSLRDERRSEILKMN